MLWPFRRAKARRATVEANLALDSLPIEQLCRVHELVNQALDTDLEGSLVDFAELLVNKPGQKMTDEEETGIEPVKKVINFLQEYLKLKEWYKPLM